MVVSECILIMVYSFFSFKFNFNETSSNSGESLSPDLFDIWLNGDNEYKLPGN